MDQDKKDPLAPKGDTNPPVPLIPAAPLPAPAPPVPAPAPVIPAPLPTPAPKTGAGIDLSKILLPKKETPGQTPQSAQRINAGALLEQEQLAGREGTKPQEEAAAELAAKKSSDLPSSSQPGAAGQTFPQQVPPQSTAEPKKDEPLVKPLETYQGDIERLVQDKNVSVLSIATAEAERRSAQGSGAEKPLPGAHTGKKLSLNIAMIAGGIVLLAAAAGVLAYVLSKPAAQNSPAPSAPQAPFISVDDTKTIALPQPLSRSVAMSNLESSKEGVQLSLGLISRLLPEVASTTQDGNVLVPLQAQDLLTLLAPDIPQNLLLSIQPTYLLGVHVYDDNQPFLILQVNSYETAYAGMLAWESSLQSDLAPLFTYTPSPHIPEEGIATSTASSTSQFIQTGFVDQIVENHDARVLVNQYGDIYLLWTFLDRNTLVITTNDATLREIISRLQTAPVTPIPGQ